MCTNFRVYSGLCIFRTSVFHEYINTPCKYKPIEKLNTLERTIPYSQFYYYYIFSIPYSSLQFLLKYIYIYIFLFVKITMKIVTMKLIFIRKRNNSRLLLRINKHVAVYRPLIRTVTDKPSKPSCESSRPRLRRY